VIKLSTETTSSEVINKLSSQGINFQHGYNGIAPSLPEDITSVDDSDLMSLFSLFTEYNSFLLMQIATSKIDKEAASKEVEIAEAKFLIEAPKGETVSKTKAKILIDETMQILHKNFYAIENYLIILEGIQKGVDESSKVVSREITRRNNNYNISSRTRNFTT